MSAVMILFAFQYAIDPQALSGRPVRVPQREEQPALLGPRARRAQREACVARIGEVCRPLVENHPAAIAALSACSVEMGKKLSEFHTTGALAKMPNPDDLLKTISKKEHGDEVADWAIKHAEELADPDAFSAFISEPLEFTLALKQISAGATEARARRLAGHTSNTVVAHRPFADDWRNIALLGGAAVIAGLLVWMNRRRPGTGLRVT